MLEEMGKVQTCMPVSTVSKENFSKSIERSSIHWLSVYRTLVTLYNHVRTNKLDLS